MNNLSSFCHYHTSTLTSPYHALQKFFMHSLFIYSQTRFYILMFSFSHISSVLYFSFSLFYLILSIFCTIFLFSLLFHLSSVLSFFFLSYSIYLLYYLSLFSLLFYLSSVLSFSFFSLILSILGNISYICIMRTQHLGLCHKCKRKFVKILQ